MFRSLLATAALAGLVGLSSTSATALTTAPGQSAMKGAIASQTLIEKVHGCHRGCVRGPNGWWHRHVGPYCEPVGCSTGPRCWRDCYWVGPFKSCTTKCR